MRILVTGGTGYIGSHTSVDLIENGYDVIIVDNLSNSKIEVLDRIHQITGKKPKFYKADLTNRAELEQVFSENEFSAIIHFAGLKAVAESVKYPLKYYRNNLIGSITLFELMEKYGIKNIVFSSSATVYGTTAKVPFSEDSPLGAVNPYGRTKLMIEDILRDMYTADPTYAIAILRYFNPVGAHPSGLIGEDPNGIPNNLMPYMAMVAAGSLPKLYVYGNDYDTTDGTGVRDYIHVMDLSAGHIKALEKILSSPGLYTYNLGTGRGYSVLEMIHAFEAASGRQIPYEIVDRRPGDIAVSYADVSKAERELGWKAKYSIQDMCADTWRWQLNNLPKKGVLS